MRTWALVILISVVLPAKADWDAALRAYEHGDYATALKEWQSLADRGDPEAAFRLGAMYERGVGVSAEPSQAVKWYQRAADQGHAKAQFALGRLYADGRGILQDYVEAHKWLNLASSKGDQQAAKLRDKIAVQMTPAQVAEAQRLAKEWKPASSQPPSTSNILSSGEVFRVGNGVSAPAVLYKVDPEYSEEARKAHLSRTVLLNLIVDATGRASNIHVVRGLGNGLDEKAVEALNKWKFKPGYKEGQPVAVAATIEVNFRLFDPPPKQTAQQPPPQATPTAPAETTQSKSPSPASDPSHESQSFRGLEAYKRGDYATAYREWLPLAEAGDSWAQIFIATIYYLGRGVAVDFDKALDGFVKLQMRTTRVHTIFWQRAFGKGLAFLVTMLRLRSG